MEVTPQVFINPQTGEETISYDHAVVTDHGYIDDVQRQHRELEQRAYYEDANGIHNRWADAIPDEEEYEAEYEQPQYQEEEVEEDSEALTMQEFSQAVFDEIGFDNYKDMTNWAYDNLSDDWIEEFNDAVDSGDVAHFERYLLELIHIYNQES